MNNEIFMNDNRIKTILRSDKMIIGYISLFTILLHLIAIEGFGYFRDELYYISCSNHLAFGYVDQPPLSIFLLKTIRFLLGDSLIALRLVPAVSSGLMVFVTGMITKELGGKRFALLLASISAMASIGNFFLYSIYSMNFLDHLFWLALIYILLRIIKTGNTKLWLWFGIIAGLGLQNKISVLFLGFSIAIGIVMTEHRKHLKNKYIWMGALSAGLIFLPYILWNMANNWPMMEFINNARMYKMSAVSPFEFLKEQILNQNPATFLVWISGLWFFFFNKSGRKYRIFGWVYLSLYILFTIQQAKSYYLSPIYPILYSGGAIMLENIFNKIKLYKVHILLKSITTITILVSTLVFAPICLPILSQQNTIAWLNTLGIEANSGENHKVGALPQHFADMHGWPEMTEKVSEVFATLSSEEQNSCLIFGQNYGETGAINFFGKKYNLPLAISGHNNHYLWPPKAENIKVMIIIGGRKSSHLETFEEVQEAARTSHPYAMPYENDIPIYVCKKLKLNLQQIWPKIKHFN